MSSDEPELTMTLKELDYINHAGMIAIYIAASVFGLILLSFFVRLFLSLYRTVKDRVPRMVALHQLVFVS